MTWTAHILPYIEQQALYNTLPLRDDNTHPPASDTSPAAQIVKAYVCPSDPRANTIYRGTITTPPLMPEYMGLTYYAGVGGLDWNTSNWPVMEGMLYWRSRVRLTDVLDGTSGTLLVGERPPMNRLRAGWWMSANFKSTAASWPLNLDYEFDVVQYVANTDSDYSTDVATGAACFPALTTPTDSFYQPGRIEFDCDFNHFWSHHPGGAHFSMADGSVRFIAYTARPVMQSLATRRGGEVVSESSY